MSETFQARYTEDGGSALVTAKDLSDAEWLRYEITVEKVEQQPRFGGEWKKGESTQVSWAQKHLQMKDWTLRRLS